MKEDLDDFLQNTCEDHFLASADEGMTIEELPDTQRAIANSLSDQQQGAQSNGPMHEHKQLKNQVQWKLSSNAGAIREDEIAVLDIVAAMEMVAADVDKVGINLTTVQDAVVAATPLVVVETPLLVP